MFELPAAADRALFTSSLSEVTAQAGETIIRRGEAAPGLYLIRKGRVRIVDDHEGKDPVVLAIRGQGESFGERSLLTGNPTSAAIQAAEDVVLLRLDPATVQQLLEGSGDLRQALEQRIDQDREFDFLRTLPLFAGLGRADVCRHSSLMSP